MNHFQDYIAALAEAYRDGGTEQTGRTPLENLLRAVAGDMAGAYHIQQEPLRERESGAPDFKVKTKGRILGYVETKKMGANLDEVLKSDQIKRYQGLVVSQFEFQASSAWMSSKAVRSEYIQKWSIRPGP